MVHLKTRFTVMITYRVGGSVYFLSECSNQSWPTKS